MTRAGEQTSGGDKKSAEPTVEPTVEPTAEPTVEELRQRLAEAQRAVEAAQAELARQEQKDKLEVDLAELVGAYRRDYPPLEVLDSAQRNYLSTERRCLREILTPEVADEVPEVAAEPVRAVADLEAAIAAHEADLAAAQVKLAAAVAARDRAKAAFDKLTRPAASIKARLSGAETAKSEVKKAHDAGQYAVALWMLDGRFQQALDGEPPLVAPDDLAAAVRESWMRLADAEAACSAQDAAVKTASAELGAEKARLAELKRTLDAQMRQRLAALTTAEAKAA
jgi:hypothetical protein